METLGIIVLVFLACISTGLLALMIFLNVIVSVQRKPPKNKDEWREL